MSLKTLTRVALLLASLIFSAATQAQTCAIPAPLQSVFQSQAHLSITSSPGSGCGFLSMLDAAAPSSALAFAYYRRPPRVDSLRFGFRLDTSAFSGWSALRAVKIFAASARDPHPAVDGVQQLLSIYLSGTGSTPRLKFLAADDAQIAHTQSKTIDLAHPAALIRIEITRADSAPGAVRYWIDADYTDPPSGVVEASAGAGVDNAAWGSIEGVALGLGDTTSTFRASYANTSLIFDQIQSSDDFLFWSGFEP